MSVSYGFYNSLNGDRKYDTSQVSHLFDGLILDGVYATVGNTFAVNASSGLTVTVGTGRAWFDHTWTLNDAPIPLTLEAAHVIFDRIDAIVLETNATESVRVNSIKVITGVASSSPADPVLTDTDLVHQYPLCYIYVAKNATEITQANIINKVGSSACPFVTGIISITNIDQLVAQWQAMFNVWFDEMKGQLSTDAAGNLQNEIDAHTGNSAIHMSSGEKTALNSAVQTVKFGGTASGKTGTEADISFAPLDDSYETVGYVDGTNVGFLRTGFLYCPDVVSNNPFGNSDTYMLYSMYDHNEGMVRYYRQFAFDKYTAEMKERIIDSNNESEGWFPQHDDNSTPKHYTKYPDGRLHEWGFQVAAITVTSAYGSMFLYSHFTIALMNHCYGNMSANVNICSSGALIGIGATLQSGSDNILDFNVLSPVKVSNLTATFMYDVWCRWKS